jgi:addiction module HigA family antidote
MLRTGGKRREFEPFGLRKRAYKFVQHRLAISIGVDARRINEIVLGKRRVTADTALRLAKFFGMSPQFWMGLQSDYDLDVAEDELGDRLEIEVRQFNYPG